MEVDRFAGLRREIDALVAADPAALSSGEDVLALAQQVARLDAVSCRQAASLDEDPVWPLSGAHGSAAWVTTRRRCPQRVARKRRRLGHALRNMALVEAAWLAGDIGVEHVDVLVAARTPKLVKAFERDEAELVGYATGKSFREFKQQVAYWVQENAPDDAEKDRVRQCAGGATLEIFVLLGKLGDPVESLFQKSAFAARPHHIDCQFAEHTREAGHGISQRRSVFDAAIDVVQDFAERLIRRLVAEDPQRAQQGHAAAHQ